MIVWMLLIFLDGKVTQVGPFATETSCTKAQVTVADVEKWGDRHSVCIAINKPIESR